MKVLAPPPCSSEGLLVKVHLALVVQQPWGVRVSIWIPTSRGGFEATTYKKLSQEMPLLIRRVSPPEAPSA